MNLDISILISVISTMQDADTKKPEGVNEGNDQWNWIGDLQVSLKGKINRYF